MARRKSRTERLGEAQAADFVAAGLTLRKEIIRGCTELRPFNQQYSALHDLIEKLDLALADVAGKPVNYRVRGLGL